MEENEIYEQHLKRVEEVRQMCKRLETVEAVALMLNISKQALYEAVRKGLVPAVKIGRRIRFDLDALETWLECGGSPWGEKGAGNVV